MKTLVLTLALPLSLMTSAAFADACSDQVRADVNRAAPGVLNGRAVRQLCNQIEREEAELRPEFVVDDGTVLTTMACAHAAAGGLVGGLVMLCYDWIHRDVYGLAGLEIYSIGAALGAGHLAVRHPANVEVSGEYGCGSIVGSFRLGARAMLCTRYDSVFKPSLVFSGLEYTLAGFTFGATPILVLRKF